MILKIMQDKKKIKIVTRQTLAKMNRNSCRVCKKPLLLGQSYISKPTGYSYKTWSTYYHGECAIEKGVIVL